jgi:DNA modification methylase
MEKDIRKNPAKFTDSILEEIAKQVNHKNIKGVCLDPFAGSGKIAKIKQFTNIEIHCNDIEDGWKEDYDVDVWYHQDAEFLVTDRTFDAIITSPTYGNRMADHHKANDGSRRITYTHRYGQKLSDGNTGVMHFGKEYKDKHTRIFTNLRKLLKSNGLLMVNVSNFIRNGEEVDVVGWWKDMLTNVGFSFIEDVPIATPRMKFGANRTKRVQNENLLIWKR